jgi:hypothetical protein
MIELEIRFCFAFFVYFISSEHFKNVRMRNDEDFFVGIALLCVCIEKLLLEFERTIDDAGVGLAFALFEVLENQQLMLWD